jgi:hypothetical protein
MTVYYLGLKDAAYNTREFDALDGDYRKVEVVDPTPDGGRRFSHGAQFQSGRPIKHDHVPTRFCYKSKLPVQDFDRWRHMLLVSDRFRRIIEDFEPAKHQFFPVEFVGPGEKRIANMWIMVVCTRLDAADRERTTMKLNYFWSGDGAPPNAKLVISEAAIAGHHIWCDKHLMDGPLVSSELGEALMAAEISGLKLSAVESV